MIQIDGAYGEGGGQILRTALALSLATGTPFTITRIRANRNRPGLMRQHLAAVSAATAVGHARTIGAALGAGRLTFQPEGVYPGRYRFDVGSAGSATLVLQAILPPLLTAEGDTRLILEGGTHNPFAPPFDFLDRTFLPMIRRMGPEVTATLARPGFFPAGGGRFQVDIRPCLRLNGFDLLQRGSVNRCSAAAVTAKLPRHIAERELAVIRRHITLKDDCLSVIEVSDSPGPGNIVTLAVESDAVTEIFSGFGRRGVPAEKVAMAVVAEAREYLAADVPVGRRLADQLLVPLALAGRGRFRTLPPSRHTRTNAHVIQQFLEVDITFDAKADGSYEIAVSSRHDATD
ncbi:MULTISPECIES: RNA 3'-terminal phosphate cyclase [Desulfococcus]|jgi:RNA 3'-terminal phosphate cyclase (ATP)|uniref:RNA 3'-terminal phosphate cyclase n=1 Tax=Desulfococcus multivorans DSM 2059 TaxID=1121405 RepID=S7U0L8_DESML|nr:RNA 3'-terminal phosphate cyclase [Desulfococcus multivorans]AOY59446.1 RtcA: RNA 3\'-terminal phosphate cyclase (RNA cyclase) [Desulfococcus multivorans]AQV01650.1 RNA 3'-terminal-phosphate cyclase [Desulfococcus multivorans]EPR42867.1 RNA 3'-phosphate cyclase [Desulfococcus multivorans DSM 2059]MDX9818939.1 RNA 3'-terminal phosphate cyclase [Desulfococcus multivorans]SKA00913.1 RNA 3'-terminal phosphate cyclase (ATP) [Desulfococcus multivorans DSM 2059]